MEWWAVGVFHCQDGSIYRYATDIPRFMSGKQINDRLRKANKYLDTLMLVSLSHKLSMEWDANSPPVIVPGTKKHGRVLWGDGEGVCESAFSKK